MPNPLRLDLPVLLPDAPDARDACVARLTDELAATSGVESAHIVPAGNNGLMDTPRESAKEVIRQLHAPGIEKTIMISGDA